MLRYKNRIKIIIAIFLSMHMISVLASAKERYLHIQPGIRHIAERDRAYSPLIYSGLQGSFAVAYTSKKRTITDYVAVNYSTGGLANSFGKTMVGHTARIQTYKFYHREAGHQEKETDLHQGFHWGWSNNNEFSSRNIEDMGNFNDRNEYFTSFGPALRYTAPFRLFNRQFQLEALSHVQLLGFKLQSSYVSSLPSGFLESSNTGINGFLKSVELFYPGNALNFGIQPTLYYLLKSGNMLSISYNYDYLRLKGMHVVEKSRGSWYIGIITAL